jgi:hypothetical protein
MYDALIYIKDVPILLLVSTGARSTFFFFLIADTQLFFNIAINFDILNNSIKIML